MQRQILLMMVEIQRQQRNTLVIVSHDLGVHYQVTHRLAIAYAGRLVEFGPTDASSRRRRTPTPKRWSTPCRGSARSASAAASKAGRPTSPTRPPGCRFAARCPEAQDDLPPRLAGARDALGRPPRRVPLPMSAAASSRSAACSRVFRRGGVFSRGRLTAVDDVSFTIDDRPQVLSIVGESGSGKTTLARIILRLVEPTPARSSCCRAPLTGPRGASARSSSAAWCSRSSRTRSRPSAPTCRSRTTSSAPRSTSGRRHRRRGRRGRRRGAALGRPRPRPGARQVRPPVLRRRAAAHLVARALIANPSSSSPTSRSAWSTRRSG